MLGCSPWSPNDPPANLRPLENNYGEALETEIVPEASDLSSGAALSVRSGERGALRRRCCTLQKLSQAEGASFADLSS